MAGLGGHSMENPATWNEATKVISEALGKAATAKDEGVVGLSTARIIHDALQASGLLLAPGTGASRIARERQRHIDKEGWTPEHDDKHGNCEMAIAAALNIVSEADAGWPVPGAQGGTNV